jgi:hypothetical protein
MSSATHKPAPPEPEPPEPPPPDATVTLHDPRLTRPDAEAIVWMLVVAFSIYVLAPTEY